jgi:hypothetical protein
MIPDAKTFEHVTMRGRKYPRITKYLNRLAKIYSDVDYADNTITVPSIGIKIILTDTFPFSSPIFYDGDAQYIMVNFPPCINLDELIPAFLEKRDTLFRVNTGLKTSTPLFIRSLRFFIHGGLAEYTDVKIRDDMTVDDFVEYLKMYYDPSVSDIYTMRADESHNFYSALCPYENKQMGSTVRNKCCINVVVHDRICEQALVDLMKKHVTLNLSVHKIVSTPDSGHCPSIIRFHLGVYKDNIDNILENVFGMKGVCVKYGSRINMVVFYLDTYLNIFAVELENRIPELKNVENLPDMLLTKLSEILTPKDEPYFSIMLALFGNISGVAPEPIMPEGYQPDDRVMRAYEAYEQVFFM